MAGWLRRPNQQSYSCMRAQVSPRKTRSKGTWKKVGQVSQVIGGVLSLVIAIAAWQAARDAADSARDAANTARKAMQIQETTSLLNVEPHLLVEAAFQPLQNPPTTPRILLWNKGRVDAVAVTVQMTRWEGNIQFMAATQNIIPDTMVGDIAPSQTRIIPVSEPSTQADPSLAEEGEPARYPFIELVTRYMRAVDRKSYELSSYYFVSTTGQWVAEDDPRADTEFHRRIRGLVKHRKGLSHPAVQRLDPVHVRSD